MKTLILLRHAKSSWTDPACGDFDRPLAERGLRDGPRMGAWLAAGGYAPELVLCSAAARTKATFALVKPHLTGQPKLKVLKTLYLATPERLLREVQRAAAEISQLLIIGHNPGMEELARALAATGSKSALADLRSKFPSAAAAILTFDVTAWADVGPRTGDLAAFMVPKKLG
jgi:phosphohistidine phosphatase